MRDNTLKVAYHFAYDEASSELRAVLNELEQLCAQKVRVEKLTGELKAHIDVLDQSKEGRRVKRIIHQPNCTVVTRLTVL